MRRYGSRFLIFLLFLSAGILFTASSAEAVLINFDDQPTDTIITVQYAGLGVIFSTTNPLNPMRTDDGIPGPPFTPPNSVRKAVAFTDPLARYRADFTVPVSMVKVTIGDFDADPDNIFLRAFDALNNQIAEALGFLPDTLFGGIDLMVSVSGIAYVEWGSQLTDTAPNSVFTDNFEFNAEVVAEPSSLVLLSLGLAAVAHAKRSRRARILA